MIAKKPPTKKIRLRFPPSPTGPVHIGTMRTMLFNYLFAKQHKGTIVLRIEDTDKERSKLEWVQNIIDELQWLGITWDEGPDIGGKYGPYKQSQRTEIYKKYLEDLIMRQEAYYCFCTPDELEAKRQDQASRGLAPRYDGTCRNLPPATVEQKLQEKKSSTIRFKIKATAVAFEDLIRGRVEFDTGLLGDIVIAKDLETPLYHFAVVVDDQEMNISHIIRGEDHISNTPRQILLQEALGFDRPIYAHIPLLLNPDKSKMSKRAGDVAVTDYHKAGYLPEAVINFIALMGWNPGNDREFFSLSQLEKEFSLEKVQKGGAVFNVQRLDFMNGHYIKEKPLAQLTKLCLPYLPESKKMFSKKEIEDIIALHQPRMKKLTDIAQMADYFFQEKLSYDKKILAWKEMQPGDIKEALLLCDKVISETKSWKIKTIEANLLKTAEDFNKTKGYQIENRGYLLWPLRIALSGKPASAGPFEIAEILGKERALKRIQQAIDKIGE